MTTVIWLELLVRGFHFSGIAVLIATLSMQNLLIQREIPRTELLRLTRIDSLYGLSAMVTLIAGSSLWLWLSKSTDFYSHNPVFLFKIGLFSVIGLLSLIPTIFFLKHRKTVEANVAIPKRIILIKRLELTLFWLLPFLAAFMARGIGL